MSGEDIDERLEGLAHRTAGVRPRPDFGAKVMAAIAIADASSTSTGFGAGTWRIGWRLLPVAALAACTALVLAVKSADLYDDALVSTIEDSGVELGW